MTIDTHPPMAALDMAGTASASGRKLSAILLVCLFAVEALIFYWTVVHNVAPFYPTNSDQTSYYLNTYEIIAHGWFGVLDEFIRGDHATGVGYTAQGAMLGLLFGANRTVIISLNLIYFLILQWVLFRVITLRTNSAELGWISIALLISTYTIFGGAGGIYDFRIDFVALCLYGIWISSVLWSDTFRCRRRSLIVAAAAILLISFRYFTALYIAAVLGGLLALIIWSSFKSSSASNRNLSWLRARNLFTAGVVVVLVVGPSLFSSRHEIYNYYGVGHVLGEEKYIRAHQLGLFTILDHVLYYPKSVYKDHLGWPTVALMAYFFAIAAVIYRTLSIRSIFRRLRWYALDLIVLGFACFFPLVPLTVDISKSFVVGGIITVPIVALVTLLGATVWREPFPQRRITPLNRIQLMAQFSVSFSLYDLQPWFWR